MFNLFIHGKLNITFLNDTLKTTKLEMTRKDHL